MRFSRILSKFILGFPRYLKTCAIVVIIIFIIESVILNTIILVSLWHLGSAVARVLQAPGGNFVDKLAVDPVFQQLVYTGKDGGFKSLIEHTLGRLHIIDDSCVAGAVNKDGTCSWSDYPRIQTLGIDVSGAGEVTYIYRRMQKYYHKPWTKLIIDIGANDGLMSSNSFNFVQWGWSAILVEPQASQLDLATRNLRSLRRYPDQTVDFVQAVIGDTDGHVRFKLSKDIVSMESHIIPDYRKVQSSEQIIQVDSYSVASFARKYKVPRNFGILSIDAEGAGSKILHQWIHLGFRPAYIIYEALHDPESIGATINSLEKANYVYLTKLGWNSIFEYDFSKYNSSKTNY